MLDRTSWLILVAFLGIAFSGCLDLEPVQPATTDGAYEGSVVVTIAFAPDDPVAKQPVAFTLDVVPDSPPLWNFADGTSSREESPTHAFRAAGHYDVSVSLQVNGQPASTVIRVSVADPETMETPPEPEEPPKEPEETPGPAVNETESTFEEPEWGSPEGKGIRPGVNMVTNGAGCTTSFVFTDNWHTFYLSTAAHCVEAGESSDTNGCTAPLSPADTTSRIDLDTGGSVQAPVAYSSWKTMQGVQESSADACRGNDFALLDVTEHIADLHPASLHFRAPKGMATQTTVDIWGYGASSLKAGLEAAHPKRGEHIGLSNGGWSHLVYLGTPGIPGDSGGHILTVDGFALGIASTLGLAPYPASNHYTDVGMAVNYAVEHGGMNLQLVTWDDFNASLT